VLAAEIVAKAPPDGYTLLMSSNGLTITPHIVKLNYDPVKDPSAANPCAAIATAWDFEARFLGVRALRPGFAATTS
jgi:tripartite-type tricarboxylate transporter receptor subunit TctC